MGRPLQDKGVGNIATGASQGNLGRRRGKWGLGKPPRTSWPSCLMSSMTPGTQMPGVRPTRRSEAAGAGKWGDGVVPSIATTPPPLTRQATGTVQWQERPPGGLPARLLVFSVTRPELGVDRGRGLWPRPHPRTEYSPWPPATRTRSAR